MRTQPRTRPRVVVWKFLRFLLCHFILVICFRTVHNRQVPKAVIRTVFLLFLLILFDLSEFRKIEFHAGFYHLKQYFNCFQREQIA